MNKIESEGGRYQTQTSGFYMHVHTCVCLCTCSHAYIHMQKKIKEKKCCHWCFFQYCLWHPRRSHCPYLLSHPLNLVFFLQVFSIHSWFISLPQGLLLLPHNLLPPYPIAGVIPWTSNWPLCMSCFSFIPGFRWDHPCCVHGQRLPCGMLPLWGKPLPVQPQSLP